MTDKRLHTKGNTVFIIEKKAKEDYTNERVNDKIKKEHAHQLISSVPRGKIDKQIFQKSEEEKQKLKELKKQLKNAQ